MRNVTASSVLISIILLGAVACADSVMPTDPVLTAAFKKGGGKGGKPGSDPIRLHVAWHDNHEVEIEGTMVPAGIRGDGRDAVGAAGESAYQGGICGVNAALISGGMTFDTYTATECGALRVHRFWMDGAGSQPHTVATKTIARDLESMQPGESRTDQFEGFHVGLTNCSRVLYGDAYGTDNPRRTRLPDLDGARRWLVESQGTHRAICVYTARGKDVLGTVTAPMPFAYTITEVVP
jgi:hypothetical protein